MTQPPTHPRPFDEQERRGVYRAIEERRDIRNYRPDDVPDALVWKLLNAAHHAPSVGFMQPWNFLVIRDRKLRGKLYSHFVEVNDSAQKQYQNDRAVSYQALKLQGILDAPVNLLITCDSRKRDEPVLGRFTMRHMDEYSTCLAVQNLWLAARAEGLGVGWMSLMKPEFVAELFALPAGVLPVAYLTLGYPVSFPAQPLLARTGWSKKLPLESLVFQDQFGQLKRPPPEPPLVRPSAPSPLTHERPVAAPSAPQQAQERQAQLTKPRGSLGRLEQLALHLAAVQGRTCPSVRTPVLLLFAADHGVAAEGVSAYLPVATAQMMYQYIAGSAAVNVLCRQHHVQLRLVDVGIDHDFREATGLQHCKVRRGTRNFTIEPAMTADELNLALETGRQQVASSPESNVIALGEMGIANTSSASAIFAALTDRSVEAVVGRGTGVGDSALERKRQAVQVGLDRHPGREVDQVLQCLGGFEIAALVGAIEQAAAVKKLVVLDGFITSVAALAATRRSPAVRHYLVASHVGAEQAHGQVLAELNLQPVLDLALRLGEGTGALIGISLLQSAANLMAEMSTYEEANLKPPLDPRNTAMP